MTSQDPVTPPAPSSPSSSAPKAQLVRGKEAWGLGVLLVLALVLPCVALAGSYSVWTVVAYAALTVAAVHAAIFSWLWWRYRTARTLALADARLMLGAKVKTQLTLIMAAAAQEDSNTRQRSVQNAAEEITHALQALGEDSLREWHLRHDEALRAAKQAGLNLP